MYYLFVCVIIQFVLEKGYLVVKIMNYIYKFYIFVPNTKHIRIL